MMHAECGDLSASSWAIEFFRLFITKEIPQIVVFETNTYAEICLQEAATKSKRRNPVHAVEIEDFHDIFLKKRI